MLTRGSWEVVFEDEDEEDFETEADRLDQYDDDDDFESPLDDDDIEWWE